MMVGDCVPNSTQRYGSNHHMLPPGGQDCKEGSLPAEIRELHAQLQALDDVTGQLRARLGCLIIDRPRPCDAGPSKPIDRCEIAGQVHAAVDLACLITSKVNDMLCGLEL